MCSKGENMLFMVVLNLNVEDTHRHLHDFASVFNGSYFVVEKLKILMKNCTALLTDSNSYRTRIVTLFWL